MYRERNKTIGMLGPKLQHAIRLLLTLVVLIATFPMSGSPVRAALDDQEQRDYRWYDNVYSPPDKPQPCRWSAKMSG